MGLLTEVNAITERVFIPLLVDNVLKSNVIFVYLARKAARLDGGTEIVQPVLLNTASTATSYAGADTLPLVFDTEIYAAEFPWCQYAVTVPITGLDDLTNSGRSAVINLVKAKLQVAEASLRQTMGSDLQGDGTGNKSKVILGLKAAVDDGTGVVTYGNISRTNYTNWKAYVNANSGTGRALTLSLMDTVFENVSLDNERPNLLGTTHLVHSKYLSLLQPFQRFGDASLASMGFQNVLYQNRPVVVDEQIATTPNHRMWLLNTKFLTLYVHRERFFRFVPFQQLPQQDVAVAKILFAGQLVCSSCRLQGRFDDLDPTL